ncbi:amidohydrolase family protein [Nocardioides humilatus]|uniref:Amidohydrolase family protein n=1 Tax=Nocardioides humilatus TaxID=2607660 RepID=A0A5B1LM58_9ACTN|nr:amidohydrolase family protein [Nocardioides humilatus]KAA1421633.1 amidohydrolase family protein [Nocardioides humilatus]
MSDLLVRRARLVPLLGTAQAVDPVDVLVRDGVITDVAPVVERPPGIDEYDAAGRWVLPGLWDTHVHLGQWTLARQRLDTSRVHSVEEAVSLVAHKVSERPGTPVIGWGHRPGTWSREPTTADLDLAAGVTPVVLVAGDAHHAWLNSAAQGALGLPLRDGMVRETEWFEAYERLNSLTDTGDDPASYRETLAAAAALGVVGLVDLEFTDTPDLWRERWKEGADLLRVRTGVYAEHLDEVIAEGLRTGDPLLDDPRLTMGPLKIISDGSLNTGTAWCHHPYATGAHPEHPAGAPNLDLDQLTDLHRRAHAHGLEVATHAIGDAAVGAALTAYERSGARGSLEHVQLIAEADVARMATLGLRASVQPHHLVDDRDLTERVWPDRTDRCFAFRWLLDAGVAVSLGSDAPVSPLDPWLAIDAAVRRTGDGRGAWHGEQAMTRREALAASVGGNAISPHQPGDLVVLDHDPLTTTRPDVALTVVAGRVAHRA